MVILFQEWSVSKFKRYCLMVEELRPLASAFLCRIETWNQRQFDLHLGTAARLLVRLALAFD
jgi:hypothetical protein